MVLRGNAAFFYFPEHERAAVAMDHFPGETGQRLFAWYIAEVLHVFLPKIHKHCGKVDKQPGRCSAKLRTLAQILIE
jgi:hypothetical protein